jgi:hypothetical protein
MKRAHILAPSLAILLALFLPAFAADSTEGEIAAGASSVDTELNQNRAGEYRTFDDSAAVLGWFDMLFGENSELQIDIEYLDPDEQDHSLELKAGRSFWFEGDLSRLQHNLPHDPLTNLQAWDGEGKIVKFTDENPNDRYGIRFEEGHAGAKFRPVSSRAWELALMGRQVNREGSYQHRSTDHCYSCHIVGETRPVDASLNDLTAQVAYRKPNWGVTYSVTSREYEDDADPISRLFDPAHHPVKTVPGTLKPLPVFGNRLGYGVTPTGVPAWQDLAVGLTTEFDRTSSVFSGYWNGARDHFDASMSYYTLESVDNTLLGGINTGYEYEYQSLRARWVRSISKATRLRIKTRWDSIDSDDAQIPLTENLALAGPTAGQTYVEAYPQWADLRQELLVRESAADRDVWSAGADLTFMLGEKRRHRLNFSLERNDIDRDDFAVTDSGSTSTTEYVLGARLRGSMADRKLRYRLEAEYYQADDPFNYVDGSCRTAQTDPAVSDGTADPLSTFSPPWNSLQYFEMYATRFANVTNIPDEALTLRSNLNLSLAQNATLTVHGKVSNQKNDETEVSDWTKDEVQIGSYLWWSPNPKLYAIAAADVLLQEQETHVCIPLMNG